MPNVCHMEDVIIVVGLANVLWVDVIRNAFKFQLYLFYEVCWHFVIIRRLSFHS